MERNQARVAIWVIAVPTVVIGATLLILGNMIPAAVVLLSGGLLGTVLGVLGSVPQSASSSRAEVRRRAAAMLIPAGLFLVVGSTLLILDIGNFWQVLLFAGASLTLGSLGLVYSTRKGSKMAD